MVHPNWADKICSALPKIATSFVVPKCLPWCMHTDLKYKK